MPSPISRVPPQTLKKAKASFKARGRPSLSAQEQRQLDRAVQLDRRAWGLKEREKRRAEAVKKRQEKEKREKEERTKTQVGGDRQCDRFGFQGSQVCLGVFFGRERHENESKNGGTGEGLDQQQDGEVVNVDQLSQKDDFGAGELEDDVLLSALQCLAETTNQSTSESGGWTLSTLMPSRKESPFPLLFDLHGFEDELASSTQIARELDAPLSAANAIGEAGDASKSQRDRALMPPPGEPRDARQALRRMAQPERPSPGPEEVPASNVNSVPTRSVTGFTLAELENFVEEDLQLTQADTG